MSTERHPDDRLNATPRKRYGHAEPNSSLFSGGGEVGLGLFSLRYLPGIGAAIVTMAMILQKWAYVQMLDDLAWLHQLLGGTGLAARYSLLEISKLLAAVFGLPILARLENPYRWLPGVMKFSVVLALAVWSLFICCVILNRRHARLLAALGLLVTCLMGAVFLVAVLGINRYIAQATEGYVKAPLQATFAPYLAMIFSVLPLAGSIIYRQPGPVSYILTSVGRR